MTVVASGVRHYPPRIAGNLRLRALVIRRFIVEKWLERRPSIRQQQFTGKQGSLRTNRFPLETVPIPIGDRTWQITCVTDQDALLDGVNEVEHVPYGFLLWEATVALAGWLAACPARCRR